MSGKRAAIREASCWRACIGTRAAFLLILAHAITPVARAEDRGANPPRLTAISPIFSQLVAFSQPADFVVAFEKPSAKSYIREAVLKGETVEAWSQMITVTGAKGLASASRDTPRNVASRLAGGFEAACPNSFRTAQIGDLEISGHSAFAAVISCGSWSSPQGARSETALIVAIKGKADYYTLQWAERGNPGTPPIDALKWRQRLDALGPIRLCAIVPGEKAPFPSCTM